MLQTKNSARVAFGTFEADLSTGELWRGGFRIKLQGQPFRVLAELVQNAGHVVTREELQQRVWDRGTNVDFDHSLGTAVNKIREALGDTADNPRYVETLPRRGYRFIAPVTLLDPPAVAALVTPAAGLVTAPTTKIPTTIPLDPTTQTTVLTAAPEILPANQPSMASEPSEDLKETATLPVSPPTTTTPKTQTNRRWIGWTILVASLAVAATVGFFAGRTSTSPQVPTLRQVTHSQRVLPGGDAMEAFPVTVTDGLHLFASVIQDGSVHLARITIAGGASDPIVLPDEIAGPAIADISHDGSRLLVRSHASNQSEQPLFIVPATGGSAQRIVRILAHDATWMPDDKKILYATGNELLVADADGYGSAVYANLPGRAFWLRWSPDGKVLRFTLFDPIPHTQALWELTPSNHTAHPVLSKWVGANGVCCGSWLPDSSFVFQAVQGTASDLWLLAAHSTNPARLTDGPLTYQGPVAARTDRTIYLTGASTEGEVQQLAPNSHEFSPVRNFYSDAHRIEQTRDGQWLAWVDTVGRLWRAHTDGTELLQLTPGDLQVFSAHWSPDGSRIALMARKASGAWSIYQEFADGSDLQPLLETGSNTADPTWSPDGQTIVLGLAPDLLGKDAAPRTIQMLDLRTHQLITLPGSDNLFSPRWSPDGRYIVALPLNQQQMKLYDTTTKQWRTLSSRSAADPVWSADSHYLYADAFMDPGQPVYRVSVADGNVEELGGMSKLRSSDFSDMVLAGVLRDGTAIIRARLTTANLYALSLAAHPETQ